MDIPSQSKNPFNLPSQLMKHSARRIRFFLVLQGPEVRQWARRGGWVLLCFATYGTINAAIPSLEKFNMGMDQYLLIPFLGG